MPGRGRCSQVLVKASLCRVWWIAGGFVSRRPRLVTLGRWWGGGEAHIDLAGPGLERDDRPDGHLEGVSEGMQKQEKKSATQLASFKCKTKASECLVLRNRKVECSK